MERLTIAAAALVERLALAGCVAPEEEAAELAEASGGDPAQLERLVLRREQGEPLAWLRGFVPFCGQRVAVHPGIYVPRHQTEALAARAAALLDATGTAVDLCTGSGAVARTMAAARPAARVLATDADPQACRCAAANGVEVFCGHLAEPLPAGLDGSVDVVTAVVPYVPTADLVYLPRDVRDHEPRAALDGGPDGLRLVAGAVRAASSLLRPGGVLLLELGGDQDEAVAPLLAAAGFTPPLRLVDTDGDLRAVETKRDSRGDARRAPRP